MHNTETIGQSSSSALPELAGRPAVSDKRVKLFIGLPIYKEVPAYFVQCLLALQVNKPCDIEVHLSQGDGIARARNALTADFLKSDCTHLLFIDSDLLFSSEHIARLLSHDVPLVGGMYPKKQEGPIEWVFNTLPGTPAPMPDGLLRVRYIGTGFLLIARKVFEMMISYYPALEYRADYGDRGVQHDFWSMGVYVYPDGTCRYLSEDWYFCQRWLDMGLDVLADTKTILRHVGPAVFPLKCQEAGLHDQPPAPGTPPPGTPMEKVDHLTGLETSERIA